MASEDLLKKAVAAFNALSPEQQAEMLEEQRQSWVRGNVGLSRDERGMTSPTKPNTTPVSNSTLELAQRILDMRDGKAPPLFPRVEDRCSVTIRYGVWEDDLFALATAALQNNTRPAPAATDTGLETVRYEIIETRPSGTVIWQCVEHEHHANEISGRTQYPSVVNALCRRSQAVELLAAEISRERDLAAKQLSEVVDRMSDDYLALKADNAVKDAENAYLKELIASRGETIKKGDNRIRIIEAKLAAAEKALETEKILADRLASALEYIDDYSLSYPDLGTITAVAQPALKEHSAARSVLGGKPS